MSLNVGDEPLCSGMPKLYMTHFDKPVVLYSRRIGAGRHHYYDADDQTILGPFALFVPAQSDQAVTRRAFRQPMRMPPNACLCSRVPPDCRARAQDSLQEIAATRKRRLQTRQMRLGRCLPWTYQRLLDTKGGGGPWGRGSRITTCYDILVRLGEKHST